MKYEFDWDLGNLHKINIVNKERGFSIDEIESVFGDSKHYLEPTYTGDNGEKRYLCVGKSVKNRVVTIVFTLRNGKIRPFNAWKTKGSKLKKYRYGEE